MFSASACIGAMKYRNIKLSQKIDGNKYKPKNIVNKNKMKIKIIFALKKL